MTKIDADAICSLRHVSLFLNEGSIDCLIFTSAKESMLYPASVCLICLYVSNFT